jgi:hypothetical protein
MKNHLLSFVVLASCATAPQPSAESLTAAYRNGSASEFSEFLDAWQTAVPISEGGDNTAAFDAAVQIFKDLYRPRELQRLGRPEWGSEQYRTATHAIVQKTLTYQIVEDEKFPGQLISQTDTAGAVEVEFCPALDLPNMKRVCLTDAFERILLEFLGDEAVPPLQESIMSPSRATGESQNRLAFLNQRLKIYRGHWGGWYLETHPRISLIRFNRSMTEAIAYFQVVHQGGEARYQKVGGKWVFQHARFTWIT